MKDTWKRVTELEDKMCSNITSLLQTTTGVPMSLPTSMGDRCEISMFVRMYVCTYVHMFVVLIIQIYIQRGHQSTFYSSRYCD